MKSSIRHIVTAGCSALAMAATLMAASDARAQACGRTASSSQFDSFYAPLWGCQQVFINDMWSRFSFHTGDWDGGMGYEDPCNDALPLKRTFNALQLLGYGVTASPTCSTSDSNVGLWAYCWSGNAIDELDGRCSTDARATTQFGAIIDNWTQLKVPFFYDSTVVQRAGTIFHEARHAQGWCSHTSSCLDGGSSCDPNWGSGCVGTGSGSGAGANAYTVLFMNWFATTGRAGWINATIRADAVAEGNRYLSRRFGTDPCFRMDSNGYTFQTC
jgi:hypothetical protein